MSSSRNLIKGYQDLSRRSAARPRAAASREDRIFQVILPHTRAAHSDFLLDGASDWDAEILLEGDFLSPLQS